MADKLLASHILAKVAPPGLFLYLIFGDSASYNFSARNGMVEECSRSVDFVGIVLAAVGVAIMLFLLRIAASPRSSAEERGVLGNRVGAAVVGILAILLLVTGIAAEGPTDLATCSDSFEVS